MSIYELEERVFFDGAMPTDIAEVNNASAQLNETENAIDNESTLNTENVSIDPDSSLTEDDSLTDNIEDSSSEAADEIANVDLEADVSYSSDAIATIIDSLDDVTLDNDIIVDHNFLIASSDNENIQEIADSLNDNTTLITYDSDDSFDSIIQQLKDELGDNKAVNIAIVDFDNDIFELGSDDSNELLSELSNLQYFDGKINVIDLEVDSETNQLFTNNLTLITDNGIWFAAENTESDFLTDYFDSDSVFCAINTVDSELTSKDLYFIDYNVADSDQIISDIFAENSDAVIVELGEGEGIDSMTDIINQYSGINSVHIVSNGNSGQILLGNNIITADNAADYQETFSDWNDNLSDDADILFYGSDIAKEAQGQDVLDLITDWTSVNIDATDISYSDFDNWTLEYANGFIDTESITLENYNDNLETYIVTEAVDDGTGSVVGTLSWAIAQSNVTKTVDETINFDLSDDNTITISGGGLTISDDLTIEGNGVTISFEDGNAALVIDDDIDSSTINVTINDLTIIDSNDIQTTDSEETVSLIRNSENLTIINTNIDDIGYVYAHIPGNAGSSTEIYFIDSAVENYEDIVAEIPDTAVVIALAEGEGIASMTEVINSYSNIDAVHIISQANYAQVLLGSDVITDENITDYQEAFSSWNDNLSRNADILFYGCEIAEEAQGQDVLNQISEWTGADIAASTDVTGGSGGNWDLEFSVGTIETASISVADYDHHLETYTVTEITDNGTSSNVGSLSWAIDSSNDSEIDDNTIVFNLDSGDTITLSAQTLAIINSVTIDGTNIETGNDVTITVGNQTTSNFRVFRNQCFRGNCYNP